MISVVTTAWFTIGCWGDMRLFFRRLKTERVDATDDGTVSKDADPVVPNAGKALARRETAEVSSSS